MIIRKKLGQNEKLLKTIERHDKEKETKQQKSKILGRKPVKRKTNKEKSTI